MITTLIALLLITGLLTQAVLAQQTGEAENQWQASAELGYVATSGNTNTDTLNVKANASTDREIWRHNFELTGLNASDNDVRTAQKYTLTAQSDYKLGDPNYLFGRINYEDDRFSGFDYQVTEALGYGRRVVDSDSVKLDLEIGPGARQTKPNDGKRENEALLIGAAKLVWKVSATSTFSEVLTMDAGEDTRITKSVSSLSSQIDNNLSMKITYTYKYTSDVPEGIDDTDSETAVTLVYNF